MKSILLSLIFLLSLFSVSHFIFEPTYLYHELTWLDIPMHLLGGLGVGLLIISVANYLKVKLNLNQIFFLFFVVAVVWEVYEYARGVMIYDELWKYLDTIKDLCMGSLGLLGAYQLIKK